MILTAILNAILAVAVTVMVVAPLVWAILTQRSDHAGPAATDSATMRARQTRDRRLAARPQYAPRGVADLRR
jgi:hypothetical protein